ncbi:B3 domain-containing protein [Apostasia shenzhenica]|uniref:B3 domain-containing protein n=1 Tax=Apostasia shenzhenica TaxID=1088818 RepID=A0A2I0ANE7_9ASPA|nr:B3 domain-containing protein [Apostasia shenzhenica]
MAMETISYEEIRRRKLEENKKKLEDLKLGQLSHALRDAVSPKTSPAKQLKRKMLPLSDEFVIRRRSDRLAKLPGQCYKERRDLLNRVYASDEARAYAVEKAEELQSQLDSKHPSFVKPMLQSHVTGGFWLVSNTTL